MNVAGILIDSLSGVQILLISYLKKLTGLTNDLAGEFVIRVAGCSDAGLIVGESAIFVAKNEELNADRTTCDVDFSDVPVKQG